jgi:hypothetical protein
MPTGPRFYMVESGDDLYVDSTRNAIFRRITTIQDEAISLKKFVFEDTESWVAAHGVDLDATRKQAQDILHKLKTS